MEVKSDYKVKSPEVLNSRWGVGIKTIKWMNGFLNQSGLNKLENQSWQPESRVGGKIMKNLCRSRKSELKNLNGDSGAGRLRRKNYTTALSCF